MAQTVTSRRPSSPEPPGPPPDGSSAPRLWREMVLAVVCYAAYALVRVLIPHDETAAYAHAGQILRVEHALRLDPELSLNRALLDVPWLARVANVLYATAHFVVTAAVLVWLYRRRPAHYRRLRTALILATGVALIGFWAYPLAPPRFLGGRGFVDPVTALHSFGLYSSPEVGSLTNQFAAMPSMHAGWALWCAVAVVTLSRRPLLRVAAILYPLLTILVIFSTANHYLLDAVAGIAIMVGALAASAVLTKRDGAHQEKNHKVTKKTTMTDGSPLSI